jgi:hypothetical protein
LLKILQLVVVFITYKNMVVKITTTGCDKLNKN